MLHWPRWGSGKRAVGLVAGVCFFVAGWSGSVGTGRAGWCWIGTGRISAGTSTLCSGAAGGVMSGTLGSGAGSGAGNGGAVARFKIWAIWM